MKIVNFGACNIDYVYSVNHIFHPGETISATKMELFPGGKGLNQSIAIAKAGSEVYHAGCIGVGGEFLEDIMRDSNVNLSYLKHESVPNGHAFILLDKNGENSICIYKGSNGRITKEYIDQVLYNFSKGDILVLQNEINNVEYLIEAGYQKGMKIFLTPSPFNETMKSIDLSHISYIILNMVEAKALSGKDTANEFIEYMNMNYPDVKVVLTLGKKGAIYADKNQVVFQSAFIVDTVDTTGAGDTFTGYFVSLVASGVGCLQALKYSSAASALAVSQMGAANSIPFFKDVDEALRTLVPYTDENEYKKDGQRNKIYEYIEANIAMGNLNGLARFLGYSASYTGTLVKNLTKKTFSQLLQEKKCEVAAKYLRDSDMSVGEIIRSIGYENESFFRKKFRNIYGEHPLKYRKKFQDSGGEL